MLVKIHNSQTVMNCRREKHRTYGLLLSHNLYSFMETNIWESEKWQRKIVPEKVSQQQIEPN